jgi:hypothetical protein
MLTQSRRKQLYYSIGFGLPPIATLVSSLAFLKVISESFGVAFIGAGLWSVVFGIAALRLREPPRPFWKSALTGLALFLVYNSSLWFLAYWIVQGTQP